MKTHHIDPTSKTYGNLEYCFEYFNRELFAKQLPYCLITLVNKKGASGYYAPEKFKHEDEVTDEIALNPAHFKDGAKEVMATLVHEMVHLWQKHFGKTPRRGYHDKQWAGKMESLGLVPSDTGKPGGKKTGQRMADYPEPGGRFEQACQALLEDGPPALYQDMWALLPSKAREASKASKTKYTCPVCDANCWAKPESFFFCGRCEVTMKEAE